MDCGCSAKADSWWQESVRCCAAAKAVCWWEHMWSSHLQPHVAESLQETTFLSRETTSNLKTWKHLQALLHHHANVLLLLLYPSIHHNCESAQKVLACMGLNPRPFELSGLILWLIPVGFGSIPMAVTQVMQYWLCNIHLPVQTSLTVLALAPWCTE